jgi:starvation-inducible DNA-binding protein
MKTNIGITAENREAVSSELCKLLADEYVLYTKTKRAHWNIEGSDFYDKHKLFESQYEQVDEFIDAIAERIRMLGNFAPATLHEFLNLTRLSEKGFDGNDSQTLIKNLLRDHESIIVSMRGLIEKVANTHHDAGTSDFITGLMEQHEKIAWFLRAH